LPGGIFSNQKSQFGYFLEGLEMENVDLLYGHLEYFTANWYILWSFAECFHVLVYCPLQPCGGVDKKVHDNKILAGKCWRENFGGKILAGKIFSADFFFLLRLMI
jgi:hypothetical protein